MSKIAITGTIASGKSSLSDILKKKGYHVFSCDEYNAYLLEKGNKGYEEIKKVFPDCFEEDYLNKKKLAEIIFNDETAKRRLEDILHPLIIEKMLEESREYDPFFAEVPLLFESNLEGYFDINILVAASKKTCIERLIHKGYSRKEAIARINNQMSLNIKRQKADIIIYNRGTFEDLEKKTEILLKELGC